MPKGDVRIGPCRRIPFQPFRLFDLVDFVAFDYVARRAMSIMGWSNRLSV